MGVLLVHMKTDVLYVVTTVLLIAFKNIMHAHLLTYTLALAYLSCMHGYKYFYYSICYIFHYMFVFLSVKTFSYTHMFLHVQI